MARRNTSLEYCRQIEQIVNSQFVDDLAGEYGYLFELIPISNNPDTDIQHVLYQHIREYQDQRCIKVKRDFVMDHELMMMARFFAERVYNQKTTNHQNILEELLTQINPNENTQNAMNADYDGDIHHLDNIADGTIDGTIDDTIDGTILQEPPNLDAYNAENNSNSDAESENNDDNDMAVDHVEFIENAQRLREMLAGNIQSDDDLAIIARFREYVKSIADAYKAETGNVGHLPPQPKDQSSIIANILELATVEVEIDYTDNIPVTIEFPKEPVDEGILNYAGPNISNYSVSRYRNATDIVSIDATLIAHGVYNIQGVELGRRELTRLLMFLSPTFAYNLTHKKFVDAAISIDLSTQLKTSFSLNFANFYGSQTFSDCTLLVAGYKFYTHKIILANESELFGNYYTGEWGRHGAENPFVIEADAHLFGKILDFVYTRKVSCNNTAEIVDLYAIADAYRFVNLLKAIESVVNPVIMVAIKKRLYQNHPRANVSDIVERIEQEPQDETQVDHTIDDDILAKMEEVD